MLVSADGGVGEHHIANGEHAAAIGHSSPSVLLPLTVLLPVSVPHQPL